jgi:hypothetical protein
VSLEHGRELQECAISPHVRDVVLVEPSVLHVELPTCLLPPWRPPGVDLLTARRSRRYFSRASGGRGVSEEGFGRCRWVRTHCSSSFSRARDGAGRYDVTP